MSGTGSAGCDTYSLMTNGDAANWLRCKAELAAVLRHVHAAANSRKCYLVIEDENENYTGTLLFDNARLCHQVAPFYTTISIDQSKEIDGLK